MIAFVVLGFRKKLNSQGSEFWVVSKADGGGQGGQEEGCRGARMIVPFDENCIPQML